MARSRQLARGLRPDRLVRRLVDLLGPTGSAARQSLVALAFNSATSFAAGAMLVGFEGTWRRLAPMLILVPPAIGLRGNVFSTLGNRLSTAIHTGAFRLSFKRDSVLAQNLLASFTLTFLMSVLLAAIAMVLATALGVAKHVSFLELSMISVVGGLLGSAVVAAATVALAMGAVRYEWDLDNLVAPMVGTLGDVITIPALWVAAQLIGHGHIATVLGGILVVVTVGATVWSWQTSLAIARGIFRESVPVLTAALVLSSLAGLVLQKQQTILGQLPAIGILQPAFVSSAGALGGILCGRVATNLHLGSVEPTIAPGPEARRDANLVFGLAVPLLLFNAFGAALTAWLTQGDASPGFGWALLASGLASTVLMLFVAALAYYSTIGAWRFNVDPDTYGVPIVTASVDFVGTMALVVAVVVLGLL
jgi:mgtE-like transporter